MFLSIAVPIVRQLSEMKIIPVAKAIFKYVFMAYLLKVIEKRFK
jgi:hypothetical protein